MLPLFPFRRRVGFGLLEEPSNVVSDAELETTLVHMCANELVKVCVSIASIEETSLSQAAEGMRSDLV
jgi:hypothetical protein